jgi:hypothetical protein
MLCKKIGRNLFQNAIANVLRNHAAPRDKSRAFPNIFIVAWWGKGKFLHEDVLGEWKYSSTHEWSASPQAALPPGKEPPVPIG